MAHETQKTTTFKGPNQILTVVIVALVIDILAFTSILPLLPRTIEFYSLAEKNSSGSLLSTLLRCTSALRSFQASIVSSIISSFNSFPLPFKIGFPSSLDAFDSTKSDIVLLGGLLGSLYSLLQCFVSPFFGRLADKYGRRPLLLVSMLGNILWTVLWIFSSSFELFLLARIIAGLCEANVQLSTTIIADVSKPENRAKQMALVGISFSLGFTFGPLIGAYFGSLPPRYFFFSKYIDLGFKSAPFVNAAFFSLFLLVIETIYLYFNLPETMGYLKNHHSASPNPPAINPSDTLTVSNFKKIKDVYLLYMFVFSGMEYTLTFLLLDLFGYSNRQQGCFLGTIGLLSALIQGGYVRRFVRKLGEKRMVLHGFAGCIFGMVSVALMAYFHSIYWIVGVVVGFSIASAIVTSTMNAIVSLLNSPPTYPMEKSDSGSHLDSHYSDSRTHLVSTKSSSSAQASFRSDSGSKLGDFRSVGQLGRAFGPGFASIIYWSFGPVPCYLMGSVCVLYVYFSFNRIKRLLV
ncbi:Major facilitator superfamily domain-containing protein 10 [Smittium mucronatum]|uniref:Major facilitator superfamily domain-containing protein 10 n=1 Tax=Smittium mucronatum TaxID=133383 RepID=A0A1R0H2Q3_9FUNG|nr:Major facilitator superfamily domain-containing protein 10 [Smittium mucronatum]